MRAIPIRAGLVVLLLVSGLWRGEHLHAADGLKAGPVLVSVRDYLEKQTDRLIVGIAGPKGMDRDTHKVAKPLGIQRIRRIGAALCYGETAAKVAEQLARGFRAALRKKRWSRDDWLQASKAGRSRLMRDLSRRFEEAVQLFLYPDHHIHFAEPIADVKGEFFARAALDQALRGELGFLFRARRKGVVADAQFILAFGLACLVQADNADRLSALIAAGWDPFAAPDPRGPFEGPLTIVYHHMTQRAQVERLRNWVTNAFRKGKVSAWAYAGSEDFYEQRFGSGKQVYGTYGSCRHGRYRPYPPIRDKERAADFWKAHKAKAPWEGNMCHPAAANR